MNEWQDVWNRNKRVNKIILEMLLKADGFDSGAGSFTVEKWIKYTKNHYNRIGIRKNESIYEVGCGSGAFLYPLYLKEHIVGGVDYSMILIELAKKIMPKMDFIYNEAINMNINPKYDILISHSVFHYFESLNYAKEVIKKMIQKANKKIAILDINDKAKEKEYHKIRMASMSREEYNKKYKGLRQMFYDKEWFNRIAEEFDLKIEIFDQEFEKYTNSKLRFNVIMEKK